MTKAVIFDLDGLLVDTEKLAYQVYRDWLAPYGYEFTLETYTRHHCGKSGVSNVAAMIETYQLPYTLEAGVELVFAMEAALLQQGVDLKPGAGELLGYLRKNHYRVALATSSTEDRARQILSLHGLLECFDAFVFGPEVANGKPAPDIFLRACQKLGQAPADCLVLEDSEAGIRAASAANIPVICVPDLKQPSQAARSLPLAILPSLADVVDYL